ncbi:MAG: Phosphoribosylformylglycinamidine cyclo-ligase [Syntrophorhabdaceae bacterium PtaU1.Bin034]|nr:MAG: Phosphoribosylformylglycinamidine cyclo-ligase [Syntrophorhabdaceae bacterium PtaU1.Bin034]
MSGVTYKDAGVDITKADNLIDSLKKRIERTFNPHVLSPVGGFASLIEVPQSYKNPVLASSTDGVGTKLRVAFMSGKHDTVGIDLVAMSVNDVLTIGAKPLYFLDYYAAGRVDESIYRDVLSGICAGCEMAACALVGGETAEMPSFYEEGEYELAGFVTAIVEKEKIVDGSFIKAGDRIIGLASNGLHSNGFSLVRKVLFEVHHLGIDERMEDLAGQPLYEELLKPTRIYVKPVLQVLENYTVKGMAHITGGGLPGNVARVIPPGLRANMTLQKAKIPAIFDTIQRLGNIAPDDMHATFNMGIGFVLIVKEENEKAIIQALSDLGESASSIGFIEETTDDARACVSIT